MSVVTSDPVYRRIKSRKNSVTLASMCVLLGLRLMVKGCTAVVTWCSLNGSVPRWIVTLTLASVGLGRWGREGRRMWVMTGVIGCRMVSEGVHSIKEGEWNWDDGSG